MDEHTIDTVSVENAARTNAWSYHNVYLLLLLQFTQEIHNNKISTFCQKTYPFAITAVN